jgi:DNA-binding Lrp family transcriptional regulator
VKADYDEIDLKILEILQRNTDGTTQDVGEAVGFPPMPVGAGCVRCNRTGRS